MRQCDLGWENIDGSYNAFTSGKLKKSPSYKQQEALAITKSIVALMATFNEKVWPKIFGCSFMNLQSAFLKICISSVNTLRKVGMIRWIFFSLEQF